MNDLSRALGDIRSIRRQVAHSTEFRGYGSATLAATAVIAFVAAMAQSRLVPDPAHQILGYISIWIATALVSASIIAVQTVTRSQRLHSGMADEMLRMAVEQFLPCVGVGALLTCVLVHSMLHTSSSLTPPEIWMLPGLWQIIFSLGVFSSCRFLPRGITVAGAWYLLTGLVCLSCGDGRALAPWSMGISFGVGQLCVAGVLFFRPKEIADEA